MVIRGAYGVFYSHTVRQGREGLLGFNPPFLVDNLLQTSVTGSAAVASAAPFRLVNGYPAGLARSDFARADYRDAARRTLISARLTSSSTTSAFSTN